MALALAAVPALAQNESTIAGPLIATGTFQLGQERTGRERILHPDEVRTGEYG
jgi:hypothetical protein